MSGEKIVRVTRWLLPPLPASSQGGKGRPGLAGQSSEEPRFSTVSPGTGERPFPASLPGGFRCLGQGLRQSLPAQATMVNKAMPQQPKINQQGQDNPAENNAQT